MPFKSKAQQRKFMVMAKKGEISQKTLKEWQNATVQESLPERASGNAPKKRPFSDWLRKRVGKNK